MVIVCNIKTRLKPITAVVCEASRRRNERHIIRVLRTGARRKNVQFVECAGIDHLQPPAQDVEKKFQLFYHLTFYTNRELKEN
jgi:NADH:ubiquinone oxidoreductase subunit C